MSRSSSVHPALTWILLVAIALTWGSSFILIKRGLVAFSPFELAAFRIVLASLSLLPFALRYYPKVPRKAWKYVLLVGVVGNGFPAFLFPLAEEVITSASAGILNTLTPIFVLVLGVSFFGIPFSGRKLAGILLGLTGSTLLIVLGAGRVNLGEHVFYALLVLIACLGYALSTNLIKSHLNEVHPIAISTFSISFMGIPYALYLGYAFLTDNPMLRPEAWASLGYVAILAIFGTAIALMVFYRLVQLTDPVFTSTVTYLIPLVAVGWGLMDGEGISAYQVLGMAIILAGVYIVNRSPQKVPPPVGDRPSKAQAMPKPEHR